MKFANLAGRATIITGTGAIDVAAASDGRFGPEPLDVFDDWEAFVDAATAFDLTRSTPYDNEALGSPVPLPRQVFGIGLNYRSHAEESGMTLPSMPATFTKFPTCVTGPFAEVALSGPTVDWEVELVVVIGQRADRVAAGEAWSHVAGVTVGQDLSDRTVQFAAGAQFSLGKSFRGYGPMGPWLVTIDELDDPDDLGLGCSIDGEIVQQARTSDLIFDVPTLIADLSAIVALLPGDVIFTGTPAGVGVARSPARFLQAGEMIESWIDGVGAIRTRMVEPLD